MVTQIQADSDNDTGNREKKLCKFNFRNMINASLILHIIFSADLSSCKVSIFPNVLLLASHTANMYSVITVPLVQG